MCDALSRVDKGLRESCRMLKAMCAETTSEYFAVLSKLTLSGFECLWTDARLTLD
jgi:hypothetical protein